MRAATVVQVSHGLFYVLLQLLVVAAIILSFKFYCKFYCKFVIPPLLDIQRCCYADLIDVLYTQFVTVCSLFVCAVQFQIWRGQEATANRCQSAGIS